ncbi:hypothetical protein K488DRAFT_69610 [Vararia minispora EC-137]|uniref:Uncharacterized protein n=1 Tax=Vararia minispora EC-137 TaxID=1314806 RepID=A0ACB8QQM3_9AGAM|nr:hypothetical protein K488DRAFT_69610 [Vararia minispora EC-137]
MGLHALLTANLIVLTFTSCFSAISSLSCVTVDFAATLYTMVVYGFRAPRNIAVSNFTVPAKLINSAPVPSAIVFAAQGLSVGFSTSAGYFGRNLNLALRNVLVLLLFLLMCFSVASDTYLVYVVAACDQQSPESCARVANTGNVTNS